ncbi:hypothetical protein UY3_07765 [Chelonia mydas]|uniref:Uncharacterized protein n=1 Tax=Chelonia mydas TaxID=8469 RepID=M7C3N6_CHEMY|nr:hypothetical protein UY3_07765 [Chelonia mydas]
MVALTLHNDNGSVDAGIHVYTVLDPGPIPCTWTLRPGVNLMNPYQATAGDIGSQLVMRVPKGVICPVQVSAQVKGTGYFEIITKKRREVVSRVAEIMSLNSRHLTSVKLDSPYVKG